MTKRAKNRVAVPASGTPRHDLPAAYVREIGRIIVVWARLEHLVRSTLWATLDLQPAEGRLVVRAMRPADAFQALADLLAVRRATWDNALAADLRTRAASLKTDRDLVAHGIWDEIDGEWYVEVANGGWGEDASTLGRTRRITPEFVPKTVAGLKAISAQIEALIADFRRLRDTASGPQRPSRDQETMGNSPLTCGQ